jgi:hypothetical protein
MAYPNPSTTDMTVPSTTCWTFSNHDGNRQGWESLRDAADTAYGTMNPDQARIFDTILERVEDPNGALFFVDGRAGREKTFLMSAICDRIRGDGGIVCVVGTTALSVIHYERGRTAHSAFVRTPMGSPRIPGLKRWTVPARPKDHGSQLR